ADLLDNSRAFKRMMVRELQADAKTYGDERRTLIQTAERAVLDTPVVQEPVTVIMSRKGWLRARQGHGHDAAQFGFKSGDGLYDAVECLTTHDLVAMTDTGRVHTVPVSGLPSARGDGQPVTAMTDIAAGSHVRHMIAGPAQDRYMMGVCQGYGFVATLGNMTSRQRSGKQFMTIDNGATQLQPLLIRDEDTHLVLLSKKARKIRRASCREIELVPEGGE